MFNENFSFLSSTSTSAAEILEFTSTDVSPFTSRSSSPRPEYKSATSASNHAQQRDTRYDTYRAPRHPSITALTAQLESHVLCTDRNVTISPTRRGSISSTDMCDNDTSADEGFFDSPDTSSVSDYSDRSPSLFDLSMADLHTTSSPRPSLSLEAQALSSYTQRRRQRQALVRLQCLAKRAPDLAMLLEECHPSSLPPTSDPWAMGTGSRRSSSTTSVSRVDKERWAAVRKTPRMRKRTTR